MKKTELLIQELGLLPHPEGGYFKEEYRSSIILEENSLPSHYSGQRSCSTAIYFMLVEEDFSAFHRLRSDEIWHFYSGTPVLIHVISNEGEMQTIQLGPDFQKGQLFQFAIPAGVWFAAELADKASFCLIGCTVSPGFDFKDFELGSKDYLLEKFPQHRKIITRLTRF